LNAQTDITTNKAAAYRLVWSQLVLTIVIASLLFAYIGSESAYSALLGGLAYILPNVWFVRLAFRDSGRSTPQLILSRFYLGETGKLVLTGIVFALCFLLVKPLHVGALFLTYIMMIIVNLAGLALISAKK